MNQHDHRAQNREAAEPEEGTRAAPKIVFVWIAILIVWGVGYYAWQIGKPLMGGDSRTPVIADHQEVRPADGSSADSVIESNDVANAGSAEVRVNPTAPNTDKSDTSNAGSSGTSDQAISNTANSEGSVSNSSVASAKPNGAAIFSAQCSACHQATGLGIPGAFPPLAGSEWILADAAVPVAIVHDGLQGKIEVAGNQFQGVMPKFGGQLSDAELAAVLSYARSQWGNNASAISPGAVTEHRDRFGDRKEWSAEELTKVFGKL
ncbi:cytochrome c [Marinobacter sp. M3C]|jgi:mono/diheme cytochrome c family protein|uniref:c-type cytochrome n=1 Tax=unclassified Marinobacter TaxID=83889 RepID=UPI00200CB8CB|nr:MULTISPECIES: cytochrome c [unclassified Marinobacter]MCL1478589.1 cytochrome c [Marinobacter sp.]MCL1484425.1 cytochrome c [Marinobacter sp.]UQG57936.1 cytochrome c [Marinobacter sp. M4C]UQG60794.1 cytochrome c [Marinobacter sp. M3C]UQG66741.1 cytochrome c [Marinobacter sp. M2C]